MATATFVQDGNSIDYTPSADVAGGSVVVQTDLLGIARRDIAAGTLGALAVTGVFDFPKATAPGSAIAAGVKAYWDTASTIATNDPGATNKYLGKTIHAATDTDATVRVRLEQ
ncbi:MAG: DUF2190 family protein [Phycisphaerales bacterium]